jgi:hypothetical protein
MSDFNEIEIKETEYLEAVIPTNLQFKRINLYQGIKSNITKKNMEIKMGGWLYKCSWCNKLTRSSSEPSPNAEGPCIYKRPQGHDWIHQGWSSHLSRKI